MAKILSLFDGMACGYIAFQKLGIPIERYVAYEIDKYAIKTATHNFPDIEECGDVFNGDYTQYYGFDYLIGGSICTYWSIAQTKHRETEASGIGWDMFSQYVRAWREAQPRYFLYENNKSMSKEIRKSISETFGFDPICINSALVSAQNRQRLYWVGKRNDDGTYSKAEIDQPEDRGILLKDVLDTGCAMRDKARAVIGSAGRTTHREYLQKCQGNMAAERCEGLVPNRVGQYPNRNGETQHCQSKRIYSVDAKGRSLQAGEGGLGVQTGLYAQPVCVAQRGRYFECDIYQHYEARDDGKTNTITTVEKDNRIAEPVRVGTYPNDSKRQDFDSQQYRIYSTEGKSVTLCGNGGGMGAKTGLYAQPVLVDKNTD